MEKRSTNFRSYLVLSAFVLILLWIAGSVITNVVNYRPVDQAQNDMITRIQGAHLLGSRKQNVIAFFEQQKIPYYKYYGVMGGDGWEAFLNNKKPPSELGMIIEGGTDDVIAQTSGFLDCQKHWSLETRAMFDAKGTVIEVEVRPTFYGCDV